MSFLENLKTAEGDGKISKEPVKDIPKSCCPACELEAYDLDAYSHSRGKETPASCDCLWAGEVNEAEMGVLIEMKGLCEVQIDFHYQKVKKKLGADDPKTTVAAFREEYSEFLEKKLNDFDIKGKIVGSNQLLNELAPTFSDELNEGTMRERVFLLCNLGRPEFNSYRQLLNKVLRPLADKKWGVPQAIPCYKLPNEAALIAALR